MLGFLARCLVAAAVFHFIGTRSNTVGAAVCGAGALLIIFLDKAHEQQWIGAAVLSVVALGCLEIRRNTAARLSKLRASMANRPPGMPIAFGVKIPWAAIKDVTRDSVVEELELEKTREADWAAGIEAAYEDGVSGIAGLAGAGSVFVTPAIDGWVLVVGNGLPCFGNKGQMHPPLPFAERLSAKLNTEVQFFATHRTVSHDAWVLARSGVLVRAFAVADGNVLVNQGAPTPEEAPLELEKPDPISRVNEDRTHELAGRWSVNPMTFDERKDVVGPGTLGKLTKK